MHFEYCKRQLVDKVNKHKWVLLHWSGTFQFRSHIIAFLLNHFHVHKCWHKTRIIKQHLIAYSNFSFTEKIYYDFDSKVDNLHQANYRKSCEKTHGSSNSWQLVSKLGCSVFGDSVKCWGVKEDPHKSQLVFPFIF